MVQKVEILSIFVDDLGYPNLGTPLDEGFMGLPSGKHTENY